MKAVISVFACVIIALSACGKLNGPMSGNGNDIVVSKRGADASNLEVSVPLPTWLVEHLKSMPAGKIVGGGDSTAAPMIISSTPSYYFFMEIMQGYASKCISVSIDLESETASSSVIVEPGKITI